MRNLKDSQPGNGHGLIVGMMVVSASAASSDFNDSAKITNTEAVDVMTALGVFEGTDKGAFDPTGILTREQAAIIVAVMLLGEEDASLTTNSTTFKDVAADRWSAGYISYCAQQNILAGHPGGAPDWRLPRCCWWPWAMIPLSSSMWATTGPSMWPPMPWTGLACCR